MKEVEMILKDGPFGGLSFTVPDKDPFIYEVFDARRSVIYSVQSRTDDKVEVAASG